MRIHVLKDRRGQIVATFEQGSGSTPLLEPQPTKGHKVESLDVPDDYARNLAALYKQRKGNTTRKRK